MTIQRTNQFHKCNCGCGFRILPGMTVKVIGRDNLGRDKVLKYECFKRKPVRTLEAE